GTVTNSTRCFTRPATYSADSTIMVLFSGRYAGPWPLAGAPTATADGLKPAEGARATGCRLGQAGSRCYKPNITRGGASFVLAAAHRPGCRPGHHRIPAHQLVGAPDPSAPSDRLARSGRSHRRRIAPWHPGRRPRLFLARCA